MRICIARIEDIYPESLSLVSILFFWSGMAARGASSRQSAVKAKVVLLGEGAVGKTSIVLRYFENKFNDKHEQTLQV